MTPTATAFSGAERLGAATGVRVRSQSASSSLSVQPAPGCVMLPGGLVSWMDATHQMLWDRGPGLRVGTRKQPVTQMTTPGPNTQPSSDNRLAVCRVIC